jgi:hypothetical protein
MSFVG